MALYLVISSVSKLEDPLDLRNGEILHCPDGAGAVMVVSNGYRSEIHQVQRPEAAIGC